MIGPQHGYSSYGGLLAGRDDFIDGPHAPITGGEGNEAPSRSYHHDHAKAVGEMRLAVAHPSTRRG